MDQFGFPQKLKYLEINLEQYMSGPTLNGAESAEASIPGVRIWGPVPKAQAIGAGALAAASSVLLAPQHPPAGLLHRLAALVPDEVLPRVSDTAHCSLGLSFYEYY